LFLANGFTPIIPVEAKRALKCFGKEHPGKSEVANKKYKMFPFLNPLVPMILFRRFLSQI
jgi:hypothetical protein